MRWNYLDGNRRWARAHGVSKLEGHRAGVETLQKMVRFVRDRGIKHLVVYAFSTENWSRDTDEVSYLMGLFSETIRKEMNELGKENVRVRFAGQRGVSLDLQQAMRDIEEKHRRMMRLPYGPVSHTAAGRRLPRRRLPRRRRTITEESLSQNMWTAEMPDPDIIIRTGGEKRLSNFLPWQSVYSELFFTETLCPDFNIEEFDAILEEFAQRERRRGK